MRKQFLLVGFVGLWAVIFLATPVRSQRVRVDGQSTSAVLAASLSDETGTGFAVFSTSPTLTTPTLGAATATTLNKYIFTAPSSTATIALASGTSLITSGGHSLTLTTTGTTAVTLPTTGTLDAVSAISAAIPIVAGTLTITNGRITGCSGLLVSGCM